MEYGTYRSVLLRLNILCGVLATVQVTASVWYFVILQNPIIVDRTIETETVREVANDNQFEVLTNVWNLNGPVWCLGILSCVVLFMVGLTIRVIRNVDLAGAIRFLWVILWVIPLEVRAQKYVDITKWSVSLNPRHLLLPIRLTDILGHKHV
jgi:hypothetical protein